MVGYNDISKTIFISL